MPPNSMSVSLGNCICWRYALTPNWAYLGFTLLVGGFVVVVIIPVVISVVSSVVSGIAAAVDDEED